MAAVTFSFRICTSAAWTATLGKCGVSGFRSLRLRRWGGGKAGLGELMPRDLCTVLPCPAQCQGPPLGGCGIAPCGRALRRGLLASTGNHCSAPARLWRRRCCWAGWSAALSRQHMVAMASSGVCLRRLFFRLRGCGPMGLRNKAVGHPSTACQTQRGLCGCSSCVLKTALQLFLHTSLARSARAERLGRASNT